MAFVTSRIRQVYEDLGRVIEKPEAFGLAGPAPKLLVNALSSMRRELREGLNELQEGSPDNDDLAVDLSEDADKPVTVTKIRKRRA